MLNLSIKIVVGSLLFLTVSSPSVYAADWGADESWINNHPKPDHTEMIQAFENTSNVKWTDDNNDNIQQTITACGDNTSYCVVKVPGYGKHYAAFTLTRSNTKIVGLGNPIIDSKTYTQGSYGEHQYVTVYTSSEAGSSDSLSNIIISGLTLAPNNFRDSYQFFGIKVSGRNITNVLITENTLKNICNQSEAPQGRCRQPGDMNNHAINRDNDKDGQLIYVNGAGTDEASAMKNITISNNTLVGTKTANSENITIGGDLTDWAIIGNEITNINNIGIAVGGGYWRFENDGWRPEYHATDTPRYGYIEGNSVDTLTEEGFEGSGIYVDGGQNILVQGNTVNNTLTAYSIGAEECVVTKNIILRDNSSEDTVVDVLDGYSRYFGSFSAGAFHTENNYTGYDLNQPSPSGINSALCNDQDNNGKGYVEHITVINNHFDMAHDYGDVETNGGIRHVRLTHAVIQEKLDLDNPQYSNTDLGFPERNTWNGGNPPPYNLNANAIKHSQNTPLQANIDEVSAISGVATTVDVLANDTGNGITIGWFDSPENGTMTISNNKLIFTANSNFTGTENLWYEVRDSSGQTTWGNLIITVTPNSGSVSATNDSATVQQGNSVIIDVLANDTGIGLSLAEVDDVWTGSASIYNGKVKYVSDGNYIGNVYVWYGVEDTNGDSDWAKITINITN